MTSSNTQLLPVGAEEEGVGVAGILGQQVDLARGLHHRVEHLGLGDQHVLQVDGQLDQHRLVEPDGDLARANGKAGAAAGMTCAICARARCAARAPAPALGHGRRGQRRRRPSTARTTSARHPARDAATSTCETDPADCRQPGSRDPGRKRGCPRHARPRPRQPAVMRQAARPSSSSTGPRPHLPLTLPTACSRWTRAARCTPEWLRVAGKRRFGAIGVHNCGPCARGAGRLSPRSIRTAHHAVSTRSVRIGGGFAGRRARPCRRPHPAAMFAAARRSRTSAMDAASPPPADYWKQQIERALLAPVRAMRLRIPAAADGLFRLRRDGADGGRRDLLDQEGPHLDAGRAVRAWRSGSRLPWTVKMVFGELVDTVPLLGSQRRAYVFIGAGLIAVALRPAGGRRGRLDHACCRPDQLYVVASLLSVTGVVLQDVVADAMSTEVVRAHQPRRQPAPQGRDRPRPRHGAGAGPAGAVVRHLRGGRAVRAGWRSGSPTRPYSCSA